MRALALRAAIGFSGLCLFWAGGMLDVHEFVKSALMLCVGLIALAGLTRFSHARPRWLSAVTIGVYCLYFLDAAIKGLLRDYFGIRPNHLMVLQAVINTNPGETQEFLLQSWPDVVQATAAFLVITLLAILLERRLVRSEQLIASATPAISTVTGRGTHIAIAFFCTLFIALHFNSTMAKENPLLFWPMRYLEHREQLAAMALMQKEITLNMAKRADWQVKYAGPAQHTMVWVVGESINRSNMSLYGYGRKTTPRLDAMRDDLLVFRDVVSSEAATMGSLMKMFTPASLAEPDAWSTQPDVLMLAREAGYKIFWVSNQAANGDWIGMLSAQADQSIFINKGAGRGEGTFDGAVLPHLAQALADPAERKLIVVHLFGAHPSYDMRYPAAFARFDGVDDAISKKLTAAGRSFWTRRYRNEYDNAILYHDDTVASIIDSTARLSPNRSATLLLSADHGQEVGHFRDHAGHSLVDRSGYEIPMLIWDNDTSRHSPGLKAGLERRAYQTDRLDHTLLGLMQIRTKYYDPLQDIASEAFLAMPRTINGTPYTHPAS